VSEPQASEPQALLQRDPIEVATALWGLLRQPVDPVRAAAALVGLSPAAARLTANVIIATSPEADQLVDSMPRIIRSLAIATGQRTRRCYGEVRGPIVWSETLAARAASAGDPQLYVCATADRAYDTGENRVLAEALRAVSRAASVVERQGLSRRSSELARHVRVNGMLAGRYREHRAIASVSRGPDARDLRRARAGLRHRTYIPALAVLRRASQPFTPTHLVALSDPATHEQHALLVAAVTGLRARGVVVRDLRVASGSLVAGPVSYRNRALARDGQPAGVYIGDHSVTDAATLDAAIATQAAAAGN
jgi:hypothetical protein